MFYSHDKKKCWFPHVINTSEFRDNLESDFGLRVFGQFSAGGLAIKHPDEELKDRGLLAIHMALKALEDKGHNDVVEAFKNEIQALCDEVDSLSNIIDELRERPEE